MWIWTIQNPQQTNPPIELNLGEGHTCFKMLVSKCRIVGQSKNTLVLTSA